MKVHYQWQLSYVDAATTGSNQAILFKNLEVPELPTLTEKSTSQIAPGSTISHAVCAKAPLKTLPKVDLGSFSTE